MTKSSQYVNELYLIKYLNLILVNRFYIFLVRFLFLRKINIVIIVFKIIITIECNIVATLYEDSANKDRLCLSELDP